MKRLVLFLSLIFLTYQAAQAQFYNVGVEPARTRWDEISTASYRIIYPEVMDSLAHDYARSLEHWKPRVGASLGFTPNEKYSKLQTVILHPFTTLSNGSVAWSPRRVDLFCTPSSYHPMPMTWIDQLVSHESRHVAQMQFGSGSRAAKILLGEFWPGLMAAIYPGPAFFEGDAVVAETELSSTGRGRMASFLEDYRVSLAAGERRSWWQWRYGSIRRWTPDYYRAGYMVQAGARVLNDNLFAKEYYDSIYAHPMRLGNFQRTVTGGRKKFSESWRDIEDLFQKNWELNDSLRAPFDSIKIVTKPKGRYDSYSESELCLGHIYTVKSSMEAAPELVKMTTDGKVIERHCCAPSSTNLSYSSRYGRLYWSERITDKRWSLESSSDIRYMDPLTGKKYNLTKGEKWFNPECNDDGDLIAAISYSEEGRDGISVLDAYDGRHLKTSIAPDGYQLFECAWVEDELLVSAITSEGTGIYRPGRNYETILAPQHTSLYGLVSHDGFLYFVSDRDGTDQLYCLDPKSGEIMQITSLRFGGTDFMLNDESDTLFFSSPSLEGRLIGCIAVKDLRPKRVEYTDTWKDPVAEKLSEQVSAVPVTLEENLEISSPKRYSKLANLVKFHSWLPVYANYDELSSMSFEDIGTSVGAGATAFFHNDLNTFYGYVAGSIWTPEGSLTPGFHTQFTYDGLYPRFEVSLDAVPGDISGSVKSYVPLYFNTGGWMRGFIPTVSMTEAAGHWSGTAGIRGYTMRPVADAGIYPRWGIGAEGVWRAWLGSYGRRLSPVSTYLVYGYVPGLARTHGVRLKATWTTQGDKYQHKYTADYALPFACVDWSGLSPIAYLRNFELYLHGSLSNYSAQIRTSGGGTTHSVYGFGGTVNAVLGNLAWVPYLTRIGCMVMYYPQLVQKTSISAVLSIDL